MLIVFLQSTNILFFIYFLVIPRYYYQLQNIHFPLNNRRWRKWGILRKIPTDIIYWLINGSTFSLICPNCKCSNHGCISLKDNNGLDDMFGGKTRSYITTSKPTTVNVFSLLYILLFYEIIREAMSISSTILMSRSETYGTFVSIVINTYNGISMQDRFLREQRDNFEVVINIEEE